MEIVVRSVEPETGWANIYLDFGFFEEFPNRSWTDNAAAIVASLAWEVYRLEMGQTSEAQVCFYDGPFWVVLRCDAPRSWVTIRAVSESHFDVGGRVLVQRLPLSALKSQCRAAYHSLVSAVDRGRLPKRVGAMLDRAGRWLEAG